MYFVARALHLRHVENDPHRAPNRLLHNKHVGCGDKKKLRIAKAMMKKR